MTKCGPICLCWGVTSLTSPKPNCPAPGKPIPWNYFANYEEATRIKKIILNLVANVNPHRPQGCLILSPANNGKSFILKSAMKEILEAGISDPQGPPGKSSVPLASAMHMVAPRQISAIYARAPGKANHKMLFFELAKPISMPLPDRATIRTLQNTLRRGLIGAGVSVVFMDELQHLLTGGEVGKRTAMDEIKVISDELRIPFILAGTNRALQVVSNDDQYLSRFRPIRLPSWKYDRAFIILLRQFELQMEVPEGTFSGKRESREIFIKCRGVLGGIVETLNEAQELATAEGSNGITLKHLRECGNRFSDQEGLSNATRD